MDVQVLKEIGLTEGETKVYLALLKTGAATSGPLTDESGVSRSKIYNVLGRLIKKGLASFIVKEKTRFYQAEDPAKLREYLDKKEQDFRKQKESINEIIPYLQLKQQLQEGKSEAQIYKGFKGIQAVHEHMYLKLKRGEGFFYLGIPSFQDEKYDLYWQRDHKRREKAGIRSRALFNQGTPKETLNNRNCYKYSEARYMAIAIKTPAWIMGYKDITVIGIQDEEGMAVEILNQKIADSFREYFEAFWKLSKRFN